MSEVWQRSQKGGPAANSCSIQQGIWPPPRPAQELEQCALNHKCHAMSSKVQISAGHSELTFRQFLRSTARRPRATPPLMAPRQQYCRVSCSRLSSSGCQLDHKGDFSAWLLRVLDVGRTALCRVCAARLCPCWACCAIGTTLSQAPKLQIYAHWHYLL